MSKEGWTWLLGVKKEHYFREGRSLCGRWMCFGQDLSPEPPRMPGETCLTCLRRRTKEKEEAT